MHIVLISHGKAHDPFLAEAINDFTGRISKYYPVSWEIVPPPKNAGKLNEIDLKKKEAELISTKIRKDDYLIALDERGVTLSSNKLANLIQNKSNSSCKRLCFLIGGAYGFDKMILERADFTWSLSSLTFPHQMVRLILCEQVYRACTILRNEKYHHE